MLVCVRATRTLGIEPKFMEMYLYTACWCVRARAHHASVCAGAIGGTKK
jgi:hypothetical protein